MSGCATYQGVRSLNEAHQLALDCRIFALDNDGNLPLSLSELKDTTRDTSTLDTFELVASGKLEDIKDPSRTILLQKKHLERGGKKRAVAYADGHVEFVVSVRQRFVPSVGPVRNWPQFGPLDETAWQDDRVPVSTDANWTRLGPDLAKEPGVLFLMAHAGIGDSFPVQDENGRTHFVVIVAEGDDQHLLLVLRSMEGSEGFEVRRDKPVSVVVGGSKYELIFPTTAVAAAANATPTTSQAMIIVKQRR
jgi:prepilin-type processing-associated H-X9-DG protein